MEVSEARKDDAVKDRFEKIELIKPTFKPESCRETPVVGYLLGKIVGLPGKINKEGKRKTWNAFVVRLTAPCLVHRKDEETPFTCEPGSTILVPETARLRGLTPLAMNQKHMVEISIRATRRDAKVEGQPWLYEIGVDRATIKTRERIDMLASAVLPPIAPLDSDDADEIPF